jgi:pyruvate dehydrogenase E1 component
MNENYANPSLPETAHAGVLKGAYIFGRFGSKLDDSAPQVLLMGSGAIFTEVIKAATQLAEQGVRATVVSVTSWSELARDGVACEREGKPAYITLLLNETVGAIIAATDYVRAVPEQVREFVPAGRVYKTLGTDGFGRSDTRAALRAFFGVDAAAIVTAAKRAMG